MYVFALSLFLLLGSSVYGAGTDLQTDGIEIKYLDPDGKEKQITVKRDKPQECSSIKISPKIWNSEFIKTKVPEKCKKSFVSTVGRISPIKVDGIETVGEFEVLEFLKFMKSSDSHLLIDTRFEDWYFASTIPSAVNIPFNYFNKAKFPDDFLDTLETLGVKIKKDGSYDFSKAKNILLFCNGAWCGQSPIAIENLIKLGYPKDKMLWYRGGLQSWMMLGFPTVQQE